MKPIDATVGIAYTTFNRLKLWDYGFKKLIQTTLEHPKADFIVSISDDGSDEEQLKYLRFMVEGMRQYCVVQFEEGKLANIARNRNRALSHVQTCDYVFLFEDDIYPFNPAWIDGYVHALDSFHHCMYLPKIMWPDQAPFGTTPDGLHISKSRDCGGIMLGFTGEMIKNIGGFDYNFGIYGFEHADLTERANVSVNRKSNIYLTIDEAEQQHWFVSADEHNCSDYGWGLTEDQWKAMDAGSIGQRLTPDEIQRSIMYNNTIWMKSRERTAKGDLYREIKWQ